MESLIIFAATYLIYVAVCVFVIVAVVLIIQGHKDFLLRLVIAGIITLLLAKVASKLYFDPRPFVVTQTPPLIPHSPENGFPSSHTLVGMLMGIVIWKYNHKLAGLLIVMAGFVGIARVLARVHHIQDIIGATIIVLIAVIITNVVINRSGIMKAGENE